MTTKDLKKVAAVVPNRNETLKNAAPVALPTPGMKDIKRMELWTKWRPLIPVLKRKDWFFLIDPGPAMAKKVLPERGQRLARRKETSTLLVPAESATESTSLVPAESATESTSLVPAGSATD